MDEAIAQQRTIGLFLKERFSEKFRGPDLDKVRIAVDIVGSLEDLPTEASERFERLIAEILGQLSVAG